MWKCSILLESRKEFGASVLIHHHCGLDTKQNYNPYPILRHHKLRNALLTGEARGRGWAVFRSPSVAKSRTLAGGDHFAERHSIELKMLKYLDPYYSNLTTAEKCIFTELLQLLKSKVLYILTAEDYGKVVLCFCFFLTYFYIFIFWWGGEIKLSSCATCISKCGPSASLV